MGRQNYKFTPEKAKEASLKGKEALARRRLEDPEFREAERMRLIHARSLVGKKDTEKNATV